MAFVLISIENAYKQFYIENVFVKLLFWRSAFKQVQSPFH